MNEYTLSLVAGNKTTVFKEERVPFEQIHSVTCKSTYSPFVYENKYRKGENATPTNLIIYDIDAGLSLDEAVKQCADFKSLIVTTKSHQVEKNGVIVDRFRVIVPLDEAPSKALYKKFYITLAQMLGFEMLDTQCTDMARQYYPSKTQQVFYSSSERIITCKEVEAFIVEDEPIKPHSMPLQSPRMNGRILDNELSSSFTFKNGRTFDSYEYLAVGKTEPIRCFNAHHEDKHPSAFIGRSNDSIRLMAVCGVCNETKFIRYEDFRDAPTIANEGDEVNHSDSVIIAENSTNRLVKASLLTGDIQPPRWTIKGVLPEDGLIELFGASGSYKSFIVLDMCYCIALNREWQGCDVNGGTVVYVAGEGGSGLGRRLRGIELHYGEKIDNFYVLKQPSNLMDAKEMMKLGQEIAEIGKAKMVIFDTLHRNSGGADENSATDFAVILKNLDTHIKPLSDLIGWVHHSGLSDGKRGRGTSSRYGSLDTQILIEKTDSLKCVLSCEKQKEAEPFEPIGFEMESVDIGLIDEELNPIKTLIPHLSDAVVNADKKEKALTKLHYDVLASLRLVLQKSGESISEEIKHRENIRDGRMADVSLWRAEAVKILPSNGDGDAKKVQNAKRMRFQRIKDDLVRAKCAIEFNDKALIIGDCELLYT